VGLGVLEGVVHKSTIASTVLGGAGNQLLLSKRKEISSGNEVVSLKSGGGRESPAGSASSLVLDGVDGTFFSPVDWRSRLNGRENFGVGGWNVSVSEELLELGISPVSHEVNSNGGGGVLWVGHDLLEGGLELVGSEFVLLLGSVGFSVLSNELHEGSVFSGESFVKGSSLWGLVVQGEDGDGGRESEGSEGSEELLSHF